DPGEAGPAEILHQGEPGLQHGQPHRTASNRTRVPACSMAGGSAPGSNITASVRPISRHPPGELRGYTAEYSPATATAPAGTAVRGEASRGTCSTGSSPER